VSPLLLPSSRGSYTYLCLPCNLHNVTKSSNSSPTQCAQSKLESNQSWKSVTVGTKPHLKSCYCWNLVMARILSQLEFNYSWNPIKVGIKSQVKYSNIWNPVTTTIQCYPICCPINLEYSRTVIYLQLESSNRYKQYEL